MSLRRLLRTLVLPALVVAAPSAAVAQSSSTVSIQASGLYFKLDGDTEWRPGAEGQVRFSFGRVSVGLGYMQIFFPEDPLLSLKYSDIFIEPRIVLAGTETVGWYVAGRVGRATAKISATGFGSSELNEISYGGGTGILIGLTSGLALDIGAQGYKLNGDNGGWNTQVRAGLSIGF